MIRLGNVIRLLFGLALAACCGLTFASAASAQTLPEGKCVESIPGNCTTPSISTGDGGRAAEIARLEAVERERLALQRAAAAAVNGDEAVKKGNLRAAISFYRSAWTMAPGKIAYKKKLLAAQHALYQQRLAGGDTTALDQLRGAEIDGRAAAAATSAGGAGNASRRSFDIPGTRVPVTPPPPASDDSVSGALARGLGLPVNLRDPANAPVASAMSKVEYMLKYNERARIEGQFPPNTAALKSNVDELIAALRATGAPPTPTPITVERVEAAYTGYKLKLKEAAKARQ